MTSTNPRTAPAKQLKKNDFLAAITETPTSRSDLIDQLSEYEFLGSWFDYLIDHFVAQGKIVVDDEGNISRSGKKGAGNAGGVRVAYRVSSETSDDGEVTFSVVNKPLATGETIDKANGWAATHNRAVKNAVSKAHAEYMATTTTLKILLQKDQAESE